MVDEENTNCFVASPEHEIRSQFTRAGWQRKAAGIHVNISWWPAEALYGNCSAYMRFQVTHMQFVSPFRNHKPGGTIVEDGLLLSGADVVIWEKETFYIGRDLSRYINDWAEDQTKDFIIEAQRNRRRLENDIKAIKDPQIRDRWLKEYDLD